MKLFWVVRLKTLVICSLVTILLISSLFYFTNYIKVKDTFTEKHGDKVHDEMVISLLTPHINQSIHNYYKQYLRVPPVADTFSIDIIWVKKDKDNPYNSEIKIEATPYFGPHNTVGIDQIIFKVWASGKVELIEYEHLESFKITPRYEEKVIKWPPEEGHYRD